MITAIYVLSNPRCLLCTRVLAGYGTKKIKSQNSTPVLFGECPKKESNVRKIRNCRLVFPN
jgi:hypothetical protein